MSFYSSFSLYFRIFVNSLGIIIPCSFFFANSKQLTLHHSIISTTFSTQNETSQKRISKNDEHSLPLRKFISKKLQRTGFHSIL